MAAITKESWNLVNAASRHWMADNAQRLSAALAFYAVLALPPILIILLFIVSLFYSGSLVTSQFAQHVTNTLGPQASHFLQTLISNRQTQGRGPVATGVAIVALLVTATGFFVELKSTLNTVWGVEKRPGLSWKDLILCRMVSFLLIIAIGFLVLISLLTDAVLAAVHKNLGSGIPGGPVPWHVADFLVWFVIMTLLFALIYKLLPDVRIGWGDVWKGAALTALFFCIGEKLLGLYLGFKSNATPYGVAGSLLLILVWIYYSAQIFLFGAEFTHAYTHRFGKSILPSKRAQWTVRRASAAENREEAETGTKRKK